MKGTSTKILVVDDDSNARILMSAVLRKAGYDVSLAGGGEDAIRRFAEERFDMVMLDVDMPDMSGIQICAVLRQQFNDQLPIVMVTGMDDVQSIEEAYESGATDFIMKPINWTLLGHRVRYLLRASKTLLELREAHATNAAILDAIPDTLIRLHETGLVLDVRTDEPTDIPGLIPVVGRPLSETYPAEINERLTSQMRRAFESGAIQDIDYSLLDMEGIRHYYETRIALINHTEALCLVRDITARKQAEAELVLSQANLQYAQAVAHLGSWYVNLETRAEEWSLQTYRIFDVREGTAVNHDSIFQLVLPADILAVRQAWQRILAGDSCTVEYRINTRRGVAWMLEKAEAVFDASGRLHRIVGTVQDISERKETENRIARLAYLDSLTGLPNRESFLERLSREVKRAHLDDNKLGILFMDFDGFKSINDTLGHHTGDLVLQAAADRLRAVIRPSDMASRTEGVEKGIQLARLGGDEFTALILDLTDPQSALTVAHRITEQMRRPFIIEGRDLRLTASIGIAVYPDDGSDVPTLLKHADTAMYHAKEMGRDNCQFYTAALTQRAIQRMNIDRDLHIALERGQFHLVYQPQFNVRAGRVSSVEALIRWNHPSRGLIPPLDFIPLAESNGLIVPIGRTVLRMACSTAVRLQRTSTGLCVAVNLSPRQLKDPDLVKTVLDILAQTGLAPELLELEVTESSLMEDSAETLATLQTLRAAGVRIALDDFGTGYSSMSYLKRMPLTNLKVDRSFVMGLPQDKDSDSIVRAIVSMAKSLGIAVTAEGVETHQQARLLMDMECDVLQGYFYSRPIAADELPTVLKKISTGEGTLVEPHFSLASIRSVMREHCIDIDRRRLGSESEV